MKKYIFVFDTNKCVGCMACVVGCSIENNTNIPLNWREVSTFNAMHQPNLPVFHLSLACNHCDDAPCMKHCPALAYKRDPETGAVIHFPEACIGCTYCTWACPFDAPKYNIETQLVEKCNFCNHKIKEGLPTACVTACPVGALEFSSIETDTNLNSEILSNNKIKPAIKVIPLDKNLTKPEVINLDTTTTNFLEDKILYKPNQKSKIHLEKEWTLVLFTLAVASLIALFSAFVTHNFAVSLGVFLSTSIISILLSSFHVGKKWRLWRFILNVKNSWLSTEILGFSLFLMLSIFSLVIANNNFQFIELSNQTVNILKYTAIFFGIFTLISVDMVYKFFVRADKLKLHSAIVVITSILLYAWFAKIVWLIILATLIKFTLYIARKIITKTKSKKGILITFIRLLFLVLPVILITVDIEISILLLISLVFLGEIIDRSEFYYESDITTPQNYLNNNFVNN